MARVLIKELTKRFGEVEAVKGISCRIDDGEFAVMLGPSGCGKTTTLRCIAGLEHADEGEIFLDDDLVNDLPPGERDIAFVFQFYALYPHLTVWANIAFPLKAEKLPKNEISRRVDATLELLELRDVSDRKPRALTPGQRQRVALGRAIVRKPRVFLMDEPLSNLDAKLRERMRGELKRLQRDIGVTTVFVTHDQVEAMSMADKIIVMNAGKIQQIGTPREVYHMPANLFVANFIGSPGMSFIRCRYSPDSNSVRDPKDAINERPSEEMRSHLTKLHGDEIVIGVRPENVELVPKQDGHRGVIGRVTMIEPIGAHNIIDLDIGEQRLKALVKPDFRPPQGTEFMITFKEASIFDGHTGESLASMEGSRLWQK